MEEKYTFVNDLYKESTDYIKHFFELMGYNPKAFNHLYNINIKITEKEYNGLDDDYDAEYVPKTNTIYVYNDYIEDMLDLMEDSEDKKRKDIVKLNFCFTLIHEILHANRAIMINNSLNINNFDKYFDNVYIQNKELDNNDNMNIALASDYLAENSERYILNKNNSLDKHELDIENRLLALNNFEELLTNFITFMIIKNKTNDNLNIEDFLDNTIENINDKTTILMAKLIKSSGTESIDWFLTSAYGEYYEDYFQKMFNENYDKLLYYCNKIFYESDAIKNSTYQQFIDFLEQFNNEKKHKM